MGWVYVIHLEGTPAYKIGVSTKDVARRVQQLDRTLPWPVRVVFISTQVTDVEWHEHNLHDYFSSKHMRGEWFSLDEKDIAEIANRLPGLLTDGRATK